MPRLAPIPEPTYNSRWGRGLEVASSETTSTTQSIELPYDLAESPSMKKETTRFLFSRLWIPAEALSS